MLNTILTYKAPIGMALSLMAATLTVAIFQVTFGFSALVAVPVGVLAYVTMFVVWARFLHTLESPDRRD
jgi:uncharacterized membrane protein YkvI